MGHEEPQINTDPLRRYSYESEPTRQLVDDLIKGYGITPRTHRSMVDLQLEMAQLQRSSMNMDGLRKILRVLISAFLRHHLCLALSGFIRTFLHWPTFLVLPKELFLQR